jgi:hypothetical protein
MIHVEFVPPATSDWNNWIQEAEAARQALIENGPPYIIDEAIYKRRRKDIFSAYHEKCVYCEGNFILVEQGDVEHYRPKKGVKDLSGEVVYISVAGKREKHPGYYWLAYDYRNLLPSCSLCNRSGKRNLFPVADRFWAAAPGEEEKESPLIFHPSEGEDPEPNFVLEPETGILGPANARAQACIDVFGLNRREKVVQERRQAYYRVMAAFDIVLKEGARESSARRYAEAALEETMSGKSAYSLAGRRALAECRKAFLAIEKSLGPILGAPRGAAL